MSQNEVNTAAIEHMAMMFDRLINIIETLYAMIVRLEVRISKIEQARPVS